MILRLKDGMDTSEPSTNGISACNLYRLASLLNDDTYSKKAKETVACFESEMLQYPWLFASFMPAIVAGHLGVKGIVVAEGESQNINGSTVKKVKEFEKQPRGGISTFARLDKATKWLRERNTLLKDFGLDGKGRVLVCENGTCREEGLEEVNVEVETAKEGLEMSGVAAALPAEEKSKETEKVVAEADQPPVSPEEEAEMPVQ